MALAFQGGVELSTYLNIAEIVISAALIVFVLFQAKGAGFTGTFGADSSIFRTRRGVEKTLFNFTVVLAVAFILISIASVLVAAGGAGAAPVQ